MSSAHLKCDWATHAAALYAVRHWHYSRRMPRCKTVKVGVWEDGKFIGVVIFSRGATPQLGKPYGLKQTELCELTRIALTTHATPVSRIVRFAIKLLQSQSPGLRLIVSFADPDRGHHGGVYQAGNWIYTGARATHCYKIHGKLVHSRTIHITYGSGSQKMSWLRSNVDPHAERVIQTAKHRYLMPLDEAMRVRAQSLALPYPKRPKHAMAGTPPAQRRGSTDPDAPPVPTEEVHHASN